MVGFMVRYDLYCDWSEYLAKISCYTIRYMLRYTATCYATRHFQDLVATATLVAVGTVSVAVVVTTTNGAGTHRQKIMNLVIFFFFVKQHEIIVTMKRCKLLLRNGWLT
jgi:hypothetical protein